MDEVEAIYQKYQSGELLLEIKDLVATVTINRPERMNAATGEVRAGIEELLRTFNFDPQVRAVLLQGAGDRAFCAGADMKNMAARTTPRPRGHTLREPKWLLHQFLNCESPLVACVNGDAVGLGATIALMCDIVVMADTARIGDNHVQIGLVAGDGGALIWPLLIGMSKAKDFLLTGRLLSAAEAKESGLVTRVVPKGKVREEAQAIALQLASGAPLAIKWTKAALNQQIWRQMVDVQHFALAAESLTLETEDNKEAAKAFVEKRPPKFEGR